jgi:hypothetical protein
MVYKSKQRKWRGAFKEGNISRRLEGGIQRDVVSTFEQYPEKMSAPWANSRLERNFRLRPKERPANSTSYSFIIYVDSPSFLLDESFAFPAAARVPFHESLTFPIENIKRERERKKEKVISGKDVYRVVFFIRPYG